jgi:hypothetical protein
MQCFFRHSLSVLASKNLNRKEKIDGLMLLTVYFMPILALLSLLIGLPLLFFKPSLLVGVLWLSIPISLYTFVGNFAPFFEVGAGLYLDGRKRSQWLIPLLLFTFLLNIPLCLKAFVDVLFNRKNRHIWVKTKHSGNGSSYLGTKI